MINQNSDTLTKISIGEFRATADEKKVICEILDSGRISEGKYTKEFENKWAEYIGTKYACAVSSGTSALIVGLSSLKYSEEYNVKQNTKVITTPLTYIATSNAIVTSGFEPIYVDIDIDTFCITAENINAYMEQVNDSTEYSIILPVHLMGYPCDMDRINKIAKKYNLIIFEDSAQAHGTSYNGKKTGALSTLSCFSFYIAHNIHAGELGAINTNDLQLIKLIRKIKANERVCDCFICTRHTSGCQKLKTYSGEDDFDPRYFHEHIGYNFKTMEFPAAIATPQIENIEHIKKKRAENVKYLNDSLEEFSDILQLPMYNKDVSYMAYPIVIKDANHIKRKKLRLELEKNGVETRPLFGCIPAQQSAYSNIKHRFLGKLPVAEYVGSNGFYIGCHQFLTQEHLDYICVTFRRVLNELLQ